MNAWKPKKTFGDVVKEIAQFILVLIMMFLIIFIGCVMC